MMKNTMKITGIVMTAAVLATTVAPAMASGQLPLLKACLAEVDKAPDPKAAKNQCVWDHWARMAEYN